MNSLYWIMLFVAPLVFAGGIHSARVNMDRGDFMAAAIDTLIMLAFVAAMFLVDDVVRATAELTSAP